MQSALEGIKVIDAGLLVQGPQSAAYLRDLGAQVIKVELPGFGDQSRFLFLSDTDFRSAFYSACNRGKRSMTLDLRTESGSDILKKLIVDTDILISNFKPGTMEDWGLGYESLSEINPKLIWAAGSTFGPLGPDSHREGADLAAQCAGGIVSTTGFDGDDPSPVGVTIADHIGSLNMTIGILTALYHRQTTGRGQKIETSLLGGQTWAQASEITHYLMSGELPGRANFGHPLVRATYRIFETSDGWIGLIAIPLDKFDEFLVAIERTDILLDERFQNHGIQADRGKSSGWDSWFSKELAKTIKKHTTAYWTDLFQRTGVRYAPVNTYEQVSADEGVRANGYIQGMQDGDGETYDAVIPPLRMSETPLNPGKSVPSLGQHTGEILSELGYTEEQTEKLQTERVV